MRLKHDDAGRYLLHQIELLEAEKAANLQPPLVRPRPPPAPAPAAPAPAPAAAAQDAAKDASKDTAQDAAKGGKTGFFAKLRGKSGEKEAGTDADHPDGAEGGEAAPAPEAVPASADASGAALSDGAKTAEARGAGGAASGHNKGAPAAAAVAHSPPPAPVRATPQQAITMLALDLYERARAADKPDLYPSPSVQWGVVEAPRVAACLHATAVLLDCLKRFEKVLPAELASVQLAAFRRSRQLAQQIANSFKTTPCIPMTWQPADMNAPLPFPQPPPQAQQQRQQQQKTQPLSSALVFPSVPK